uniref:Uncharacterized protein n=1 Tax=Strigamia maritima TaxID=126957 RepID=T1IIG7_STRMM
MYCTRDCYFFFLFIGNVCETFPFLRMLHSSSMPTLFQMTKSLIHDETNQSVQLFYLACYRRKILEDKSSCKIFSHIAHYTQSHHLNIPHFPIDRSCVVETSRGC